VRRS
jgi:hypothetical protein